MQKLNPKSVWLFFITYILRLSVFVIIFSVYLVSVIFSDFFSSDPLFTLFSSLGVIIPALFVLFIFSWIWAKLAYHFYRYELREDGFRKESGVITKKYVTIPYERIQNVDIIRALVPRILGLSDLNIQTAGASGQIIAEGRLPGLSPEVAERLRDELIRRANQTRTMKQGL